MALHLQPLSQLPPWQDERSLRAHIVLIEAAVLRRRRKVVPDHGVEGIVGNRHRFHGLVQIRVVPFLQDLAAAQVGVIAHLAQYAGDAAVGLGLQARSAEAGEAEQVADRLAGAHAHHVALEPAIALLAFVQLAGQAGIGDLVAYRRSQIQVRAAQVVGGGAGVAFGGDRLARRLAERQRGSPEGSDCAKAPDDFTTILLHYCSPSYAGYGPAMPAACALRRLDSCRNNSSASVNTTTFPQPTITKGP